MTDKLDQLGRDAEFDVVVVGAGSAGMSAALFAAMDGARVLLVERTEYVGGSSAFSAGTTWVPNSSHGAEVNQADTPDAVRRYLDLAVGDRTPAALREAFIQSGAKAVERIEGGSEVKYRARPYHPDYISDLEGSTLRGRSLEPLPFDGRKLGDAFRLVRPPIPEFTVLGGMMVDRDDIAHLLNMKHSLKSLAYSIGIIGRHAMDRLKYPRGTRLVMGNALVARLLYSLIQRGVTILCNTELESIEHNASGIEAVTLSQQGTHARIAVGRGLILASGGFNRHPQRRAEMLPGANLEWCVGAPGHTGRAQDLALEIGAHFGSGGLSNAFWAPVSVRKRKDGTTAVFPHFLMDRGKPGMIVVNQQGQRFLNETTSYHLFGIAMQQANRDVPSIPAYLVTDQAALRRYGLGMVRPGGKGLAPFLADGYLVQADTLDALAAKLGVDAVNLKNSVVKNNEYALTGVDPDFHRGETDYQKGNGDATWPGPNPTLGPIEQGPFYAVRLYPGDIGAAAGLVTDELARVLDKNGQPIAGLYACGNDMHSIMGGTYPGPGITLGPGLTFAYIAGAHAAGRAVPPGQAAA